MKKSKGASPRRQESFETFVRAVNCFGAGDYEKAGAMADKAIRLDRANWQALKLLGLVAAKAGDASAAVGYFESALKIRHDDETVLILGEFYHRAGSFAQAIGTLASYLQTHPRHAGALLQLGIAHSKAGELAAAEAMFREAVAVAPDSLEAWNSLAHTQHLQGKTADAEQTWRLALERFPDSAVLLYNLASYCANDPGRRAEAVAFLERGLRSEPSARRHKELASLLNQGGETEKSLTHYQQALELDSECADAYNGLGCIYFENGIHGEAERHFRTAVTLTPDRHDFLVNLGVALNALGRHEEAEVALRQAIAIKPDDARAYNFLAIVLATRELPYEAMEADRRAIEIDPGYQDALVQLAALEGNAGRTEQAREHYRQANAVKRNDAVRLLGATLLPPIMGTREEILAARSGILTELDALLADPTLHCSLEDLKLVTEAGFYFAFHGMNDRDLLTRLSLVLRKMCPDLNWESPHLHFPRPAGSPMRIGFVSAFFFSHSVGASIGPLIKALARHHDIDIVLISIGQSNVANPVQLELITACQHFVTVSDNSLIEARETIASLQLDVLCYADIGMRTFSSLLAHARLAPVQCVLAGHPNTSGISTVDYFFSWDRLEPEGSEVAYSESLVRLKYGAIVFWKQEVPLLPLGRRESGLPESGRLYVCPMKLQKLHPDFDIVLGEILAKDSGGWVVLFQDGTYHEWHEHTRQRMAGAIPADLMERVIFLPWVTDLRQLLAINTHAHAVLDPLHFGAGTTAILLAQFGIPMITMPGCFSRSRVVSALYDFLGVTDSVAASVDGYADLAIRFARDEALRRETGRKLAKKYDEIAYRDDAVLELASVMRSLRPS